MILIVMGVSGTGKSTIAQALSQALTIPTLEADDYHPQMNIDKMSAGIPLTEKDRLPWLQALSTELKDCDQKQQSVILACSALTEKSRDILQGTLSSVTYIHLTGSRDLILSRMASRSDHFMPTSLLDSQLDTLEPPIEAIKVDISQSIDEITTFICSSLNGA
ncbi:gluconokinase [Temperatibacter marinus]|uniref:Gluconokinase n=1 Tax=Temperatibacter marinus TaxID=1456591 RepID=A0AA52EIL0_9PROT|nr:gluconokinase [Temperatibacter marinus]WND02711.1 gluconokinase [Temperatibacter marinus]